MVQLPHCGLGEEEAQAWGLMQEVAGEGARKWFPNSRLSTYLQTSAPLNSLSHFQAPERQHGLMGKHRAALLCRQTAVQPQEILACLCFCRLGQGEPFCHVASASSISPGPRPALGAPAGQSLSIAFSKCR